MSDVSRAKTRKERIIRTASVGGYAKAVSLLVSFMMVPIAVNYLGIEQYGMWIAISSLIALFSFVDGGAANALVNMISHASGGNKANAMRSIVSSGFFMLLAIALVGCLLYVLIYDDIPWAWVLGLPTESNHSELLLLALVVGVAAFITMPCSVAGNVQRGLQDGNIEAFWMAKGQLLSLLFVFVAIQLDLQLAGFACAIILGPIVASILNSVIYFAFRRRDIAPHISSVRGDEVRTMLGTGGLFLVLQITAVIQAKADNVIIANMLGPSSVTQYAICLQLFLFIPTLMGLILAPLWPAYREALSSGDLLWIQRVFYRSMKLTFFIAAPAALILALFGRQIIALWVGEEVMPSGLLLGGAAVWGLMLVAGSAMAMLLNGLQIIKTQIVVALSAAVLNIGLSIWFISLIGVEGAVYGSVISYLVCAMIPYYFIIPRLLRDRCEGIA